MKVKISISIDQEALNDLGKLNSTTKMSTYINDILNQWIEMKKEELKGGN